VLIDEGFQRHRDLLLLRARELGRRFVQDGSIGAGLVSLQVVALDRRDGSPYRRQAETDSAYGKAVGNARSNAIACATTRRHTQEILKQLGYAE